MYKVILSVLIALSAITTCFAEPVSDEQLKVMIKSVAVDVLLHTTEGADQLKINELFMAVSEKYQIELTPVSMAILKSKYGQCVTAISFCETVVEQDIVFQSFFDEMGSWAKCTNQ